MFGAQKIAKQIDVHHQPPFVSRELIDPTGEKDAGVGHQNVEASKLSHGPIHHSGHLILIGDMWKEFAGWAKRHMLGSEPNLAEEPDLEIPHCVPDVEKACAIIAERKAEFDAG